MRRASLSLLFFALLLAVLPGVGSAVVYTVTLTNGMTFETRYQPEFASWDPNKVVLLTEYGNRISVPAADIQSLTTDTESKGFGYQIDTTTIALGWAPNDQLDPNSDEGKAALAEQAAQAQAAGYQSPVYTQQQFVDPSQLTGMPVWMTGVNAVPQLAPPPVVGEPIQVRPPQ